MTVCKRIGAWLLTLVLLVSALPYTAFAASEDSHVVNATMEETSVEDIANNVTTQLLRGAKTKDETLSMESHQICYQKQKFCSANIHANTIRRFWIKSQHSRWASNP